MPARSFRLVSFCFEGFCLETDSCKVFHCQSEPKDAELRPRLAQEKDRVLRALFFTRWPSAGHGGKVSRQGVGREHPSLPASGKMALRGLMNLVSQPWQETLHSEGRSCVVCA